MNCANCDNDKDATNGQWWHLNNYFGITGMFCPDCYESVAHDCFGQPRHPQKYEHVLKTQHCRKKLEK